MTGRRLSDDTRKKMSDSRMGEKHPRYGKKVSPETLKRMSEVRKGIKLSETTKQRMSIARQGEKHPMSKLSNIDVMIIKEALKNNFSGASIARYYKVTPTQISAIKNGRSRSIYNYKRKKLC